VLKKLAKFLLLLTAIAGLFLIYVALQPAVGTIVRTGVVGLPPEDVFARINDFHKWQDWSPWAKLDPEAKTIFEGPDSGPGATFSWWGNSDVGEGKMIIAESQPGERIKIAQTFKKPFVGTGTTEFLLQPEGAGTFLIWRMTGQRPFFQRVMCTLLGAYAMIGEQLDKGLENLDALSRK
jgi:hypothetical protein